MRSFVFAGLLAVLPVPAAFGIGGIVFEGPLSIANIPRPYTVQTGDLNKDGKLDLIAANGGSTIFILLQNPSNREEWTPFPLRVGSSSFFARAGDFDHDGFEDIMVADGASFAYFVHSNGDGTFEKAVPVNQARGPRWITVGDWNQDGNLDFASSNLNTSTVSMMLGDGTGTFAQAQAAPSGREHTIEALDYDGDRIMDLAVGQGLPGIQLWRGQGDGKFVYNNRPVNNLGCVEYIAVGDFNKDGKDDMAPTCIDDSNAYIGISTGTGPYTRALAIPFATGTESSAIKDLNGDGNPDLALVSAGSPILRVYPGTGDGKFTPTQYVEFSPTGTGPLFLISEDLDADGRNDVISGDTGGTTLTVFFGRDGERFLESADSVTGFTAAKGNGVGDFDRDGVPDLFFVASSVAKAYIYLKPGGTAATKPSITVDLASKYSSLAVADLNQDGIPDLAGTNLTLDTVQVALLSPEGLAHDELTIPSGDAPQEIRTGLIDAGPTIDLAVPASGVNQISIFLGTGDGKFGDLKAVPTIERPKRISLGDLDGDGRTDMVVVTSKIVALHHQNEDGTFTEPVILVSDTTKNYADAVVRDLDGDGKADLLLAEQRTLATILYLGKENRTFLDPVVIKMGAAPAHLLLLDIDGDGLLDITATSTTLQAVIIVLNLGPAGFADPVSLRVGAGVTSHRILDLNDDGVIDLLGFGSSSATIRLGRIEGPPPEPRFRRGDADGNGKLQINDAVQTLSWLFRDAPPLACEDAADSDDDGSIGLTDAVGTLSWLFREGAEPAPPGPAACGVDPTADELARCRARC